MTERSQRQRKTPRLARSAYLVSAATAGDPAAAVDGAAAPTGLPAETLCRYVHSATYAGDGAPDIHRALGLDPQGFLALPSGAGLTALWEATKGVGSGYSDAVIVAGWHGQVATCAVVTDHETAQTLVAEPLRLHVAVSTQRDVAVATAAEMAGLEGVDLSIVENGGLADLVVAVETLRGGDDSARGIAGVSGDLVTACVVTRPAIR